jgi:hypothetical protein
MFIALHFFGYTNEYLDGTPALTSPQPEPLNIEKIVLNKTVLPDYLNPFQKLEYHYIETSSEETVIIEKGSFFSTKMVTLMGDPAEYYDENKDGIFYRGFGVDNYPSGLFFLLQYLLIVAFVFLVIKKLLRFKK